MDENYNNDYAKLASGFSSGNYMEDPFNAMANYYAKNGLDFKDLETSHTFAPEIKNSLSTVTKISDNKPIDILGDYQTKIKDIYNTYLNGDSKNKVPMTTPSVATTNTGEPIDLGKGETGTAKRAINYLVNKEGMSKEQATAIAANLYHESRFNTKAVGDTKLGKGNEAVGIAQWRLDRKDDMFNFLKQRNLPSNSFEGQLSFLANELKNGKERKAWEAMQYSKDVKELARIFEKKFERSDGRNREQRANTAEQFYKEV